MDWQQLSTISHYQTAVAVAQELAEGNVDEAATGLQELIDAMARSERRALRSQLVRLMMHVLKWKSQRGRRSNSWASSIYQARQEIEEAQEDVPSLTRDTIEQMWDKAFAWAKRQAQIEMRAPVMIDRLTWQEVFEEDYSLLEQDEEQGVRQAQTKRGRGHKRKNKS